LIIILYDIMVGMKSMTRYDEYVDCLLNIDMIL